MRGEAGRDCDSARNGAGVARGDEFLITLMRAVGVIAAVAAVLALIDYAGGSPRRVADADLHAVRPGDRELRTDSPLQGSVSLVSSSAALPSQYDPERAALTAPALKPSADASPGMPAVAATVDDAAPASVKGRPFPVSDTILASRRRCMDDGADSELCERVFRDLEALREEQRSVPWASNVESPLARRVEEAGGRLGVVRRLECRASLCALEVVSDGYAYQHLSHDEILSLGLKDGWVEFGRELQPDGRSLLVTLWTYRRC
jgi:hypothetical protein